MRYHKEPGRSSLSPGTGEKTFPRACFLNAKNRVVCSKAQADLWENNKMTSEGVETSTLSRLLSAPGIAALAVLGIMILAVSRLFGADTILKEVVTEVVAGFGNAILILAMFTLFFRTGLERLLRRAPGGDAFAESAERLREMLQDMDQRDQDTQEPPYEEKLTRIDERVRSLTDEDIPALSAEIEALRRLVSSERGREH
jgi:hypothetical protein